MPLDDGAGNAVGDDKTEEAEAATAEAAEQSAAATPETAATTDADMAVENPAGRDIVGGGDDAADDTADATISDDNPDKAADAHDSLTRLLEEERSKASEREQKLKMALADYQNLSKRVASDIEGGVMARMGPLLTDILGIRDDFVRACDIFAKEGADTSGLDSVLKNMDSVLEKYEVRPIDALGEIFDPNMHEAISSVTDPVLDEGTITKEVRCGYALKNTIIRPSMVVISKKE